MASTRRTSSIRVLAATLFPLMAVSAIAQTKPTFLCSQAPGDIAWTTIETRLDEQGRCTIVSDPPRLREHTEGILEWDVCNDCGRNVDVKLEELTPNQFSDVFDPGTMLPMLDSGNRWLASNVRYGQQSARVFRGRARSPGFFKYNVAVRFTGDGEAAWRSIDPQLQIDKGGFTGPPSPVAVLVTLLLGLAVGVWLGRRFARKA